MTMNDRRTIGLFGGAVGALGVGAEIARAQDEAAEVDLGESIAGSVKGSVSSIATNSGGAVSGGTQVQRNELSLGEQEGLAISDASGGNNNVSFVS